MEDNKRNIVDHSPLALAFMGDSVYDLLVRKFVISKLNYPVKRLHSICSEYVCCKGQVAAYGKIADLFTDTEKDIFRRGRNAKIGHAPRSASPVEYHIATGFEAVFGYLFFNDKHERINYLFYKIFEGNEFSNGTEKK